MTALNVMRFQCTESVQYERLLRNCELGLNAWRACAGKSEYFRMRKGDVALSVHTHIIDKNSVRLKLGSVAAETVVHRNAF